MLIILAKCIQKRLNILLYTYKPLKEEIHIERKNYRNLLSTLMKKSKQAYYNKYFETNWSNIKNTWKGIKSLIFLKSVVSSAPTDIANTFNNYFASIAETTKNNIKNSHKDFSDYFKEEYDRTIFLKPTSKEEIGNISSLNSNKASGPNSIYTLDNFNSS